MDDEEKAMLNYKPPLTHMKTALWALWFVALTLLILWNQAETPADPWFTWGGWITLAALLLTTITPLIVSRDSPKIISNKLGTSIATPQPLLTIPAQSSHPAYGVWPAGSVKSWFVFNYEQTTRAYIIAPIGLVYIVGEEGSHKGKGINVLVNAHLEVYIDHSTLPPHVLEALTTMKNPHYDENMPILHGWWPLMTNPLEEEEYKEYKQRFRDIGVSEERIQDAMRTMMEASQKLTKFRYESQLVDMEKNLLRREKIVNSENADLRKMIQYLKVENKDLYERITGPKEKEVPRGLFQIATGQINGREPESNEEIDNKGRY